MTEVRHRAIIFVRAEVHDVLHTNESSGRVKYEIKTFPLAIEGMNLEDAIKKLNETLEDLKTQCQR